MFSSVNNGSDQKPEVVVTKAVQGEDDTNKMAAYMNLIPAPTPTRFVGKMQKVREERKKSEKRYHPQGSSLHICD